MFKAVLLGQWHSLSDPELEHALAVRADFLVFCDFDDMELLDASSLSAVASERRFVKATFWRGSKANNRPRTNHQPRRLASWFIFKSTMVTPTKRTVIRRVRTSQAMPMTSYNYSYTKLWNRH